MRYCIRKETTGRIGSADFQRDLQTLRVFDTREEAIEGIRRRREQLSRCKADLYGSPEDYFAVLQSGRQAVVHYWVEEENAEQKTVFELNATETERLKRFAAAHRRHGGSGFGWRVPSGLLRPHDARDLQLSALPRMRRGRGADGH